MAAEARAGPVDKAGAPYILHPWRVLLAVEGDDECRVGVLHGVLEDTAVTLDMLRAEGFSERARTALESVTRRPARVPRRSLSGPARIRSAGGWR